ncbi:pilus assembly protein [Streptomyces sp. L06]|nr:pilus assembly protein [Streptomyces sp. L06]
MIRLKRGSADRGAAAVEAAIVLPFVLLFTLLLVQGFLVAYANATVHTAAREGVSASRMNGASAQDGATKARAALASLGGTLVVDQEVSVAGGAEEVTVQVRGRTVSMLPGLPGVAVSASVSGPVERWTTPAGAR